MAVQGPATGVAPASANGDLSGDLSGVASGDVSGDVSGYVSGLNEGLVLRRALQRAGEELGLSAQESAQAVGRSRTFFEQARAQSRMDRHTQRMIALVLRLHRSLSALVGDDIELMRHWINTANRHTGGIPRQQLQDPEQLVELVHYLDAMRGRP